MKIVPDSITYAIQSASAKTTSVIKGSLYIKLSDWDLAKVFFERIKKLSSIPTPPNTKDPANFDERADIFLASLPNLQVELNTMIDELNRLNLDTLIVNNNINAINLDFKPNLEKAKDYINKMLIKIELLRNDYQKNTAVLAGNDYTYSKEYLDDMFSKCIHILNHYTKFEIDEMLKTKEEKNKELFYLKSKIDEMLNLKINADEVFRKNEIYNKSEIDAKFKNVANKNDFYKKNETYNIAEIYNRREVDKKIKEIDAYKKSQSDARFLGINEKAKDSELLDGLDSTAFARVGDSYTKSEIDSRLKANSSPDSFVTKRTLATLGMAVEPFIEMRIALDYSEAIRFFKKEGYSYYTNSNDNISVDFKFKEIVYFKGGRNCSYNKSTNRVWLHFPDYNSPDCVIIGLK